MTRSTGMKNRKRKGRRLQSNRAMRASGAEVKDTVPVPLRKTGDLVIFARAPDSDTFEPFDGRGLGGEPVRWPYFHRQHVTAIAQSLRENNPGYEVEIRYMPDTAYEEFDYKEYEDSYRPDMKDVSLDGPRPTKPIRGQTNIGSFRSRVVDRPGWVLPEPVPEVSPKRDFDPYTDVDMPDWVQYDQPGSEEMYAMEAYARAHPDPMRTIPYDEDPKGYDPFDEPDYEPNEYGWVDSIEDDAPVYDSPAEGELPGFVSAAEYRPVGDTDGKAPRAISATPMETYATQTYGVEVVTGKVEGRLTPNNKANAIGESIVELTDGRTRPLKDTIRNGVYYGVVETEAPEIGERRRMLVTGRVKDNGDRTYSAELYQSDTGSPYLDVPKSYMALLDPPVTEEDVEYRTRVGERFDGDGRPWDDRRYTIRGEPATPEKVVARLSRFMGKTAREVETDPAVRGMRVHDSMDMGSEGLLVRTFGRRKAR